MQHVVNPFDETFRRAVESKSTATTPNLQNNIDHMINMNLPPTKIPLSSSGAIVSSTVVTVVATSEESTLHTPHVLPFYDDSRYRSSNNLVALSNVATSTSDMMTAVVAKQPHSEITKCSNANKRKRQFPRQLVPENENKVENIPKLMMISSSPIKTVRERLKDAILRGGNKCKPVDEVSTKPEVKLNVEVGNKIVQKTLSLTAKTTESDDEKRNLFERNREAAKRYRFVQNLIADLKIYKLINF